MLLQREHICVTTQIKVSDTSIPEVTFCPLHVVSPLKITTVMTSVTVD